VAQTPPALVARAKGAFAAGLSFRPTAYHIVQFFFALGRYALIPQVAERTLKGSKMHFGGEFVDPSNLGPWSRVNGGGHNRKDSCT